MDDPELAEVRRAALEQISQTLTKVRGFPPELRHVHTLFSYELKWAQLSYLMDSAEPQQIAAAVARASGAAHAALCARMRFVDSTLGGDVTLLEPGHPPRAVPVEGDFFDLEAWLLAWSTAVLSNNEAAMADLLREETLTACVVLPTDVPYSVARRNPKHLEPNIEARFCSMLIVATRELRAAQELNAVGIPDGWFVALRDWPDAVAAELNEHWRWPFKFRRPTYTATLACLRALVAQNKSEFLAALHETAAAHREVWDRERLASSPEEGAAWHIETTTLAHLAAQSGFIDHSDLRELPPEVAARVFWPPATSPAAPLVRITPKPTRRVDLGPTPNGQPFDRSLPRRIVDLAQKSLPIAIEDGELAMALSFAGLQRIEAQLVLGIEVQVRGPQEHHIWDARVPVLPDSAWLEPTRAIEVLKARFQQLREQRWPLAEAAATNDVDDDPPAAYMELFDQLVLPILSEPWESWHSRDIPRDGS